MKKPILIAFALTTLSLLPIAHGQTYRWVDAEGRVRITDTPPPGNVKAQKSSSSGITSPSSGSAASTPSKSTAEKDMDFKKRQKDGKEKSDKDAKEQSAAAEKSENCERARSALTGLESGQRISTTDSKGEKSFLDDEQRQKEIERAQRAVSDFCK